MVCRMDSMRSQSHRGGFTLVAVGNEIERVNRVCAHTQKGRGACVSRFRSDRSRGLNSIDQRA